ncbi:hypothetical protein [Rubricoccus marinus]|uniref:Uncharacterized protein n=1 Tax=Rubricoccus marinus TaxID=716817 RepID=A0A259TUR4_9BACT|nr:hypothetical protein [Rubricoccus marinus]OZC01440.1 hypothetical protein BSZ36_17335 [Rubricoccus marinus]
MTRHDKKVAWSRFVYALTRACSGFSRRFGHTPAQARAFVAVLALPALRARAIAAADACGYRDPADQLFAIEAVAFVLAERFDEWHTAEAAHPDLGDGDPDNPVVAAVYRHRPGRGGETESLYIATFSETVSGYGWGRSRMGELVGFRPVSSDLRAVTGPLDPRRIGFVNNSPRTRASRGFFARTWIKALLPPEARSAVGQARRARRRRKAALAGLPSRLVRLDGQPGRPTHSVQPEGHAEPLPEVFHATTKRDLFLASLDPATLALIEHYVGRDDFWRIATGDLYPDELAATLRVPRAGPGGIEEPGGIARHRALARHRAERQRREAQGQTALFA